MTELSKYYVNDFGSICITTQRPNGMGPLNQLQKPRLFKVIGFHDTGLLKHKEIR